MKYRSRGYPKQSSSAVHLQDNKQESFSGANGLLPFDFEIFSFSVESTWPEITIFSQGIAYPRYASMLFDDRIKCPGTNNIMCLWAHGHRHKPSCNA